MGGCWESPTRQFPAVHTKNCDSPVVSVAAPRADEQPSISQLDVVEVERTVSGVTVTDAHFPVEGRVDFSAVVDQDRLIITAETTVIPAERDVSGGRTV